MTRYIDADALIEKMSDLIAETWGKGLGRSWWSHSVILKDNFIRLIKQAPTADVVPKSEVERLEAEVERLKGILTSYALQYGTATDKEVFLRDAKTEVAREIFAEIEQLLKRTCEKGYCGSISDLLAELKKKYTEGNHEKTT